MIATPDFISNPCGMYVLDKDRNPVPEPNGIKWAVWYQNADRQVAFDAIGFCRVSTIFLGLDHNHLRIGPPTLYETMVFIDGEEYGCDRWDTWEDAEEGHAQVVAHWCRSWWWRGPWMAVARWLWDARWSLRNGYDWDWTRFTWVSPGDDERV